MNQLRAPFPWFGGKSRVASLVWDRFGDVRNYVEPFAGSMAVLLGRTSEPKIETVNDLDCLIANFWRAVKTDPDQVAWYADWPVNEADLHARHLWLVREIDRVYLADGDELRSFRERMKADPDYCDVKIAGWWVWGISQWIGSGWCKQPNNTGRTNAGRAERGIMARHRIGKSAGINGQNIANAEGRPRPYLNTGQGVQLAQKRPYLTNHGGGMGVHGGRKRPRLGNDHGRGVLSAEVPNQLPDLGGDSGAAGRTIHASAFGRDFGTDGLYGWMHQLCNRLRRVRVCCGDWSRILGPAPTTCIGTTAVFLDPPYAVDDRSDVYGEESRDVAHAVRAWAIANGENPELRIALCGYDGEHSMPARWTEVRWKANGGFGNRGNTQGRRNAGRERIWFSPHCLQNFNLFEQTANSDEAIAV